MSERLKVNAYDLATIYHLETAVVQRVLAWVPEGQWSSTLNMLSELGEGQVRFTPYSPSLPCDVSKLPKDFDVSLFVPVRSEDESYS